MKAISESGTVNYEGYYTKQIKSPIIKQGKVAIMVVIKSSGKNTSMGAEGTYDAASAKYSTACFPSDTAVTFAPASSNRN